MADKKKLLLICTNSDEAGAPRHVEKIANLFKDICEVTVILGGEGRVYQRLCAVEAIDVISLSMLKSELHIKDDIASFQNIKRHIKRINPDIVHGHSSKVGILIRLLSLSGKHRFIFTVHGWSWRGFSPIKSRVIRVIEKILFTISRIDYIFVSHHTSRESLDAGIRVSARHHDVIYNSVSIPEKSDKMLGPVMGDVSKFIIMPARVSSAKNHKLVIKAFNQSDYKGTLVLAGVGTNEASFVKSARKWAPERVSDILFLGETSQIISLFREADGVFLCSHYEALPISIIEALALSKRIAASHVGGIPEILGDNVAGLLCHNELEEWVQAFNIIEDDLWLEKQRQAAYYYKTYFSDDIFFAQLSSFYNANDKVIN